MLMTDENEAFKRKSNVDAVSAQLGEKDDMGRYFKYLEFGTELIIMIVLIIITENNGANIQYNYLHFILTYNE